MVKSKSTWKTNKLLTGRRNYFDIGGTLTSWLNSGTLGTNFTSDWFNGLESLGDKMDVIDWLQSNYNGQQLPSNISTSLGSFANELDYLDDGTLSKVYTTDTSYNPEALGRISLGAGVSSDAYALSEGIEGIAPVVKDVVDTGKGTFSAGAIGGLAGAIATDIGTMINNINAGDVKANKQRLLSSVNNSQLGAQSSDYNFDQLIADYGSTAKINNVTAKDLGAKGGGAIFGDALTAGLRGSAAGFGFGSSFGAYGGPLGGIVREEHMKENNKFMGGGPIGAIIGGVLGTGTSLIGNLIRNHKAKKAAREVNNQIAYTNAFNARSLTNRADNLIGNQMGNLLGSYKAFGGPIGDWDGAIGYSFMNDWLNNKREEAENKGNYDRLPKLGTFALGGDLMTHGADWDTGLNYIANGGSHESNPYEGVPMGVDQKGTPNLVEEGETIWNDYVFSRRLMVPKAIRNKYKLGGKKNISFADFSQKLAKESEERPNDPISKRGLNALMQDLAMTQEEVKARQREKEQAQMFALGGEVNKYDGLTTYSNFIQLPDNTDFYTDEYMNFWNWMNDPANAAEAAKWLARINNEEFGSIGGNTLTLADAQRLAHDFKKGPVHNAYAAAAKQYFKDNPTAKSAPLITTRHLQKGTKAEIEPKYQYFVERNNDGLTYADIENNPYTILDNGKPQEVTDENGNITRTYWYDLVKSKNGKNKYHWDVDGVDTLMGDDYASIISSNKLKQVRAIPQADNPDFYDYYYEPETPLPDLGRNKWENIGGISALNNLGQFIYNAISGPDYSNANAAIEAAKNAGKFMPVAFKPLGNYLEYKPFDRDYYINKQNAEAGASRRALLNSAAGNMGAAMSGILSADNNYINGIGNLARQAEEYNLAQRKETEGFNRDTDNMNSQGFLQAAISNQSALASTGSATANALLNAYSMKQNAKDVYDSALTASLNGTFETLENLAYQAKNDNMIRWLLENGYRPGAETYRAAHGGKLKRRKKGFTL